MARLANAESAVVEMRKLRDYCLSPEHSRGKHKAAVFSALGLTTDDAEGLRRASLSVAVSEGATLVGEDEHGQGYMQDFKMSTEVGGAAVRSGRIVRSGEDFPRFARPWVL